MRSIIGTVHSGIVEGRRLADAMAREPKSFPPLYRAMIAAGELPASYIAAQGTALGRAGRVHVERDADGQVWVGGDCVRVVQGEVLL